jgi:hypothetical protein
MAIGGGKPGCRGPITCIVLLMALRSCSSLHFPDFLYITKIGVFPGYLWVLYVPPVIVPVLIDEQLPVSPL